MKRLISRILRYYGATATLERAEDCSELRVFLRPVTGKSWQNMRKAIGELGQIAEGQAVFIGPPDCALDTAQFVTSGGKTYLIRRAEKLLAGDEQVAWWGLLELGGPVDAGIT